MKLSDIQNKIGVDKVAHFSTWGFLTFAASNLPTEWAFVVFGCTALLAVAKELTDKREGKVFTWGDIYASWLGMVLPLAFFIATRFFGFTFNL